MSDQVTSNEIKSLSFFLDKISQGGASEQDAAIYLTALKGNPQYLRTVEGASLYKACHTKIRGTIHEDYFNWRDEDRRKAAKEYDEWKKQFFNSR